MPARVLIALWLTIFTFARARLCSLNGGGINDVDTPFRQNNVLDLKLAVDLPQETLPQIMFNQLIAEPPQR